MRSELRLASDLAGWLLYHPASAVVGAMGRRATMPIAALGGDIARAMASDGAEMRQELAALFAHTPLPRPVGDIIRDAYRAAMFNELEVLRYADWTPDNIDRVCVIEGRHHLDAALANGKGVIIMIAHFGANQMIMPALGHHGYPMNQLSAPPPVWGEILKDSRANPVWLASLERRWALEQQLPVKHINVFRFLRPAFVALAKNQVLGLAFDGGGGRGWTQSDILGRTANLSTQPVQLWRKSGAVVLPTFVLRERGALKHRIVIESPLSWQECSSRDEENQRNMAGFIARFEPWLRRHPEQYLQYMLMRRRVRATDVRPLFSDYPPAPDQLSEADAHERLRAAGRWKADQ